MRVTAGRRRRLLVLLGSVIIVGAFAGPAAAAPLGPWEPNPALELSSSMDPERLAGVAVAPEGLTAAFWADTSGELVARTRASAVAPYGAPEVLGGSLLDSAGGPGDRIAVVAAESSGGTTAVQLRIREAGAGGFSTPVPVVSTADVIVNADVAVGPGGAIVVAWAVNAGGAYDVYARVGTVSGGSVTLEPTVTLTAAALSYVARAQAAIGADGRIAVSWNAIVGNPPAGQLWELHTRVRPGAGGDFGGLITTLAFAADTKVDSIATEYDTRNHLIVAFASVANLNRGAPHPITIGTVALRAGQSAFDAPIVASTYSGLATPIGLGIAAAGAVTVSWIDHSATNRPWTATLPADGSGYGPAEDLAVSGSGVEAGILRLTVAPDGTAVAAFWQQAGVRGEEVGTPYVRVREAGVASFGAAVVLGQSLAGGSSGADYSYAKLALGSAANGDATALWSEVAGGTWTPKTRSARMSSPAAAVANGTSTLVVSALAAKVRQSTIVVRATLMPSASGRVELVATTRRNDRSPRRWRCTSEASVQAGVRMKLTCTLRLGARRQLDRGALWLASSFRLTPTVGASVEAYRGLVIPRRAL
jgi:hypothetical protein